MNRTSSASLSSEQSTSRHDKLCTPFIPTAKKATSCSSTQRAPSAVFVEHAAKR